MCYVEHNNAHFIDKETVNVDGNSANIQSCQVSIQIIITKMSISQPLLKSLPRASQRHEIEVPGFWPCCLHPAFLSATSFGTLDCPFGSNSYPFFSGHTACCPSEVFMGVTPFQYLLWPSERIFWLSGSPLLLHSCIIYSAAFLTRNFRFVLSQVQFPDPKIKFCKHGDCFLGRYACRTVRSRACHRE